MLAKRAAQHHALNPQVKAEVTKADELQRRVLRHLVGVQVAIEQLCPPTKWPRQQADQRRRIEDAVADSQHVFQQELDGWEPLPKYLQCLACGERRQRTRAYVWLSKPCPKAPPVVEAAQDQTKPHKTHTLKVTRGVLWCYKCGAWTKLEIG